MDNDIDLDPWPERLYMRALANRAAARIHTVRAGLLFVGLSAISVVLILAPLPDVLSYGQLRVAVGALKIFLTATLVYWLIATALGRAAARHADEAWQLARRGCNE